MSHLPHLYLPGPWTGPTLVLASAQIHHLRRVLRRRDGEPVTYADGLGTTGTGTLTSEGVRRGDERPIPRPVPALTVAVAPPRSSDRARFLVEKLAELGVDRLIWVRTRYAQADPPRPDKCTGWAAGALEQSGGSWLMTIEGPWTIDRLQGQVWAADADGEAVPPVAGDVTLLVGPEGGLTSDELAAAALRISLGSRVLRVETAAVVGAALLLDRSERIHGKGRKPRLNSV